MQRHLHEAREPPEHVPCGRADPAQPVARASRTQLDHFVHRTGKVGFVEQCPQVRLAMRFETGVQAAIGGQASRHRVLVQRFLGHARHIAQAHQHLVAPRLQFRVGHAQ
ncbi:hypothetical protein D3C72_1823500 [compost metagenome]